jgi:hypothetical protein
MGEGDRTFTPHKAGWRLELRGVVGKPHALFGGAAIRGLS